jgi:hypothetical protein
LNSRDHATARDAPVPAAADGLAGLALKLLEQSGVEAELA